MPAESKYFVILAGPNGSGKSTLAIDFVYKRYHIHTFDWDKAFELEWKKYQYDPLVEQGIRDKISEDFQNLIQTSFSKGISVAYETNYHTNYNLQLLNKAKSLGYQTRLIFLLLDSYEIGIDRVAKRVLKGGHFVDDETIKNRFKKGLRYLDKSFDWYNKTYVIDASGSFKEDPILVAKKNNLAIEIASYKPISHKVISYLPRLSSKV